MGSTGTQFWHLFACLGKGKPLAMSRPTDPLFCQPIPANCSHQLGKKHQNKLGKYLVLSHSFGDLAEGLPSLW
jgi:hypothetical protein